MATYRLRKYVKRNRGLVASLITIAALFIAGIIGTAWFGIEADSARKKADLKAAEGAFRTSQQRQLLRGRSEVCVREFGQIDQGLEC